MKHILKLSAALCALGLPASAFSVSYNFQRVTYDIHPEFLAVNADDYEAYGFDPGASNYQLVEAYGVLSFALPTTNLSSDPSVGMYVDDSDNVKYSQHLVFSPEGGGVDDLVKLTFEFLGPLTATITLIDDYAATSIIVQGPDAQTYLFIGSTSRLDSPDETGYPSPMPVNTSNQFLLNLDKTPQYFVIRAPGLEIHDDISITGLSNMRTQNVPDAGSTVGLLIGSIALLGLARRGLRRGAAR